MGEQIDTLIKSTLPHRRLTIATLASVIVVLFFMTYGVLEHTAR
jgi:hypothetical protein